jgi:cob(I)alamin adenosyltransferase
VKIYTKTGDAGETGLFGGGRVSKHHARVDAYGHVDELNATIGLARALAPTEFSHDLLDRVQRQLFSVGAELATPDPAKLLRAAIGSSEITALEQAIDAAEVGLEPLRNFILPGGTPKAAALHVARTVCRRAERAVVALGGEATLNPNLVPYLNRLSDLLFVLARAANAHAGTRDIPW